MDHELFSLIAFSATDIIGTHRFNKIKQSFNNISEFLDCDLTFQISFLDIRSDKAIKALQSMKERAHFILEQCIQKNIQLIPYTHPSYPSQLKNIIDPPYLLYVQGTLHNNIPLIGVIGTRNSTKDAEKINQWFCRSFAEHGLGVVSGLAAGHDLIASQTIVQSEGYTVGVLGTAIDVVYPSHAKKTYDRIKESGAIISEYPPGITSTKWRFPRRNRIVSGLSQALLVIQAPQRSGTMITVTMAADQNKDVYVVPGNPMIAEYKGTNNLIQNGTKLALDPQDIIKEVLKSYPNSEWIQFISKPEPVKKEYYIDPSLSKEEQLILQLTKEHIHIDNLIQQLSINTVSLYSLLVQMELKDLIIQKPGQLYIRKEQ